jgi:hypothetical protein
MVLQLSSKSTGTPVEKEDFFAIDGTMYQIPIDLDPVEGVRYLNDVQSEGVEVAVSRLMHRVVGEDGMQALGTVQGMTKEDFKVLIRTVQRKVNGLIDGGGLGN